MENSVFNVTKSKGETFNFTKESAVTDEHTKVMVLGKKLNNILLKRINYI